MYTLSGLCLEGEELWKLHNSVLFPCISCCIIYLLKPQNYCWKEYASSLPFLCDQTAIVVRFVKETDKHRDLILRLADMDIGIKYLALP